MSSVCWFTRTFRTIPSLNGTAGIHTIIQTWCHDDVATWERWLEQYCTSKHCWEATLEFRWDVYWIRNVTNFGKMQVGSQMLCTCSWFLPFQAETWQFRISVLSGWPWYGRNFLKIQCVAAVTHWHHRSCMQYFKEMCILQKPGDKLLFNYIVKFI